MLPLAIADIHRSRLQVELSFGWIKQHFRIESFFGTSENAAKSQTQIAESVCMIVAITRKRLKIGEGLHTTLQILVSMIL